MLSHFALRIQGNLALFLYFDKTVAEKYHIRELIQLKLYNIQILLLLNFEPDKQRPVQAAQPGTGPALLQFPCSGLRKHEKHLKKIFCKKNLKTRLDVQK